MIRQSIETGHHEWEKQNIVTRKYGKKLYDIYRCKNCGIEGKSYQIGTISIQNRFYKKAPCCPYTTEKAYKVESFMLYRLSHQSLITSLKVVFLTFSLPPPGEDNKLGEWVMGVSQPVLLLDGEFEYI